MSEDVKAAVLEAIEASLEAQLRAVRRLRQGAVPVPSIPAGTHVEMMAEVLRRAGRPLHVKEIVEHVRRDFNVLLDWNSVASELGKKVLKGKQFERTGRNTFWLLRTGEPP